ncbi:MAG: undecaprenyl-diphosphate phosphatase [Verrucomicrobia bacterium]|nr:undecaprenyl-diphosphate phosphatase [Verrucomicrobiota bacterium]NBU08589.1 undecaprenyl-diphosphate phosphatase [Pseudomonadota bacterium]NDA67421.1 undecaprenyl-diphosphate phosphatase [Verrucomicrobiota bacterium]NDB75189.1 undecaprenyl-diphosphate phosphatase [Verrucomicrobiota bacterium]NDD38243.1 undecaprenyl-diphosphate phosphatase [Verrucomicrobiota bacterium]
MQDWLAVIILGIVEGITEFIPVSSTGHLLIVEKLFNCRQSDLFNVVIQGGAVLAVLPLFSARLKQFALHWREPATMDLLLKVIVAFGLTGAGGLVLEKMHFKLPEQPFPVGCALLIGGIIFVLVERWLRDKPLNDQVTWAIALAMGAGQLIAAVFPGASRSGTTIMLALAMGLARPTATEFSFLIGIPTMLAASGLKIFKALRHPVPGAPEHWDMVLLGTLVSAVVSFFAVKWLLRYVRSHSFENFGWYRILAGGLVILCFAR